MVEHCNREGGTVEHLMVKQRDNHGGTTEHLMVSSGVPLLHD